jgi:predicted membrane-bound mannosyltransferase
MKAQRPMDASLPPQQSHPAPTPTADAVEVRSSATVLISLEFIAYSVIFLFALVVRVVNLGAVELNAAEAHEALAALHRVQPDLADTRAVADAPLMAFFNQLAFFLIEPNTALARLGTAVVGALMVLGPVLWRKQMGVSAALAMSALLAVSPVALAASRTMGGVVWTLAAAFLLVWFINHFRATRNPSSGIAATVVAVAMVFLTEPTGVLTLLAMAFGLVFATVLGPRDEAERINTAENSLWQDWPWRDGLIAASGVMLVIGTGFFAAPEGLTSVGNTIYQLVDGFVTRPDDVPLGYALLVAARYDLGLLILGLIGLYFALAEDGFFARFLGGWMVFGLVMALLYQNAGPDAALWIIFPATGLTGLLVERMLRDPSIGYWVVPRWGVAAHALATTALLTAIAINAVRIGDALLTEAQPFSYHRMTVNVPADAGAKIGTFNEATGENTFEIRSEIATMITLQLWRIDDTVDPILRIENDADELVYPPTPYDDGRRGTVIENLQLAAGQTYFVRVEPGPATTGRGQFVLLSHPQSAMEDDGVVPFNTRLDVPEFWTLLRAVRNQNLPPLTVMITVFLFLLTVIAYFLVGSIWGSRAAWRGLGFGVLLYAMLFGIGLGWQASVTFGDDPRELWQTEPASPHLDRLIETLEDMSRNGTGLEDAIEITVQAPSDGSVAWALRNFPNVHYVNGVGVETTTQAVLVPYENRNDLLGDDYVGQDFALGTAWSLSDLSWLDMVPWLNTRETRFKPVVDARYMLWVRSDVYGVDEVISTQSRP